MNMQKTLSALQMDDLRVGRCITVMRGRLAEVSSDGQGNVRIKEDRSQNGNVLKIIAIDLPYILVDRYWQPDSKPIRTELDTREMIFKALSQEYVDAYQCQK